MWFGHLIWVRGSWPEPCDQHVPGITCPKPHTSVDFWDFCCSKVKTVCQTLTKHTPQEQCEAVAMSMLANFCFWQYRLPPATSTQRKQVFIASSFTTYLLLPLASSRRQLLLSHHKVVGLINCTPHSREIKTCTEYNRMRRLHVPTWEMIKTTVRWFERLSIISQSFYQHSQRHLIHFFIIFMVCPCSDCRNK